MGLADALRTAVTAVVKVDGLGKAATLRRRTNSVAYDPMVGTETTASTDYPGYAGSPEDFSIDTADGAQVQRTRLIFIPQVWTVVPDPATDTVIFAGQTLAFSQVKKIMSGDQPVAYVLTLGK